LPAVKRIELLTRIFSMGVLHHAMTGTGAVASAARIGAVLLAPDQRAAPPE
jgi:2-methylaconitate cis-trans-isomerase PrpF